MSKTFSVDRSTATTKQLLIHLLDKIEKLDDRIQLMEERMSDLTASVDALKSAVDGVAQRLLPQIATLESALAAARADDANAAAVLAEAETATAAIRLEADRLNALGADPATPVDPDGPNINVVPVVEDPTVP